MTTHSNVGQVGNVGRPGEVGRPGGVGPADVRPHPGRAHLGREPAEVLTTALPVTAAPRSGTARGGSSVAALSMSSVGFGRFVSPLLVILSVALLPLAVATTNLSALDGWGLAKVLGPAAWGALLCAIAACLVELRRGRPRIAMLAVSSGVLILCSTGMPSVIEPAARFGTSWTIAGFVDAVSVGHGVPPGGIDARFFWPAFFAQWAWFRDASGVDQLDLVLRWFPPVVVAVWATGIYALARSMLGGTRAPWVAAWLFVGLNWIEQDYFSPQAWGIVLLLTVLTFALGPLATRRIDRAGVPGWPAPRVGARRLGLLRRWLAAALTPPNRPTLPPKQLLLVYFCTALCLLAVVPEHQLTPFAIIGQLALLAVCGRFRGRGLVLVAVLAVVTFILIAGRDFWTSQLGLLIGSGGGQALQSGVANRISGDAGQVDVKYLRIIVPALTYVLGGIGALVYYRRRRDIVPIGLAIIPMAFALQGYGGEVFLRIVLYGLPILTILGTDALRSLARSRRRIMMPVLTTGMVVMFGLLVLIRGGNDSYQAVFPQEVAMYRQAVAETPPGQRIVPLAFVGPNGVVGVGRYDALPGDTPTDCSPLLLDPVRCVLLINPDVVIDFTSIEKQGEFLYDKPAGWSLAAIKGLVATGKYKLVYQNGYDAVLRKVGPAPGP